MATGTGTARARARCGHGLVLGPWSLVRVQVRTTMVGACGGRSGSGDTNALKLECREGGIVEECVPYKRAIGQQTTNRAGASRVGFLMSVASPHSRPMAAALKRMKPGWAAADP